MRQNGRKPMSALSVVPKQLDRVKRIEPPDSLGLPEIAVWVAIVNGHPADWFDVGAVPTMAQLCRHVVVADRIATMIETTGNNATLLNLLTHQRAESDAIRRLSASLRLTPQTLINHNGNKQKQGSVINAPHARFAHTG
jgi:hypothetical protein